MFPSPGPCCTRPHVSTTPSKPLIKHQSASRNRSLNLWSSFTSYLPSSVLLTKLSLIIPFNIYGRPVSFFKRQKQNNHSFNHHDSPDRSKKGQDSQEERTEHFLHFNIDNMAGITLKSTLVAGLAAVASAMPAFPRFSDRQLKIHDIMRRQSAAEAALGINDFDVLQL